MEALSHKEGGPTSSGERILVAPSLRRGVT